MTRYLLFLAAIALALAFTAYRLSDAGLSLLWSAVDLRSEGDRRAAASDRATLAAGGGRGAAAPAPVRTEAATAATDAKGPALAAKPASPPAPAGPPRDELAVLRRGMPVRELLAALGPPQVEETVNGYTYLTYRQYRVVQLDGVVIGWAEYAR